MTGFTQSPWIIHYDASSCNGCDIETLACLTPLFDVERLGVVNTGNPKHADIFLVTGAVNEQCKQVIRNIHDQMPEPKVVVAVGVCAASGGIFRECYNVSGGVDTVVPVDVYVPGCAARPEAIIDGVVRAVGILEQKRTWLRQPGAKPGEVQYGSARRGDAAEILALQKVAFQTEVEPGAEEGLPVLQQTLEELEHDFEAPPEPGQSAADGTTADPSRPRGPFLFVKAVVNGKIIGAVCGRQSGSTVHLRHLVVHPYYRRRGIGGRLYEAIERAFPEARRFEVCSLRHTEQIQNWFNRLGYRQFKAEPCAPSLTRVYWQKERA